MQNTQKELTLGIQCNEVYDNEEKEDRLKERRRTFYKNKFRCRMFVPIDDNFDGWWKKNDDKTEKNSERV